MPVPPWVHEPETDPLGRFWYPSEEQRNVRVLCRLARFQRSRRGNLAEGRSRRKPVIAGNRIGEGQAFIIGDTAFALNKNFDSSSPNANFWHSQLKSLARPLRPTSPRPSSRAKAESSTCRTESRQGSDAVIRPWIGIALLGVSWLLGLDYYETASPWAQAVVLVLGAWMLAAGERANPFRATREAYPELTVAILLLLLPVAWWTPWPYRLSPLAIIAGLVLERVPFARRLLRPVAAAWITGGVILLVQSVVLTLYAAVTARSHDLPGVLVKLLAGLAGWRESMRPAMGRCSSCSRCGSRIGWPSPGTWSSIRPR